jgi:hypothetical protein
MVNLWDSALFSPLEGSGGEDEFNTSLMLTVLCGPRLCFLILEGWAGGGGGGAGHEGPHRRTGIVGSEAGQDAGLDLVEQLRLCRRTQRGLIDPPPRPGGRGG